MPWIRRLLAYSELARRADQATGRGRWPQWLELLKLSRGPGAIGPGDYYTYRLFDPGLSWEQKLEFVGWRREALLDGLNQRSWACLGLDKVLTLELLGAQGLACTKTLAIYKRGPGRPHQRAEQLADEAALRRWLRDTIHYPFFSKPSASGFGRGACLAHEYLPERDALRLGDGSELAVDAFDFHRADQENLGYLFQRPVTPDPSLQAQLGPELTSLRIMVLLDEETGPQIHRAFWKFPTGANFSDNYNSGSTGNLAAAIDYDTGRVLRVINGIGLDLRELRHHPDTGADLHQLSVPGWPEVQAFALRVATLFPHLRFQQWDIALSASGPLALELNLFATGGCDLTQLLERRGLLDARMRSCLAQQGLLTG
ncbi:sugar-transfer associated ATP-grasp domain-containing protein [Pelomonas sp. SE-A7]|uniref:sugar-transfer associated ATP-grasp domain-containing protein n=1 Tax=Pelomonas sp. SE-A7 TaxID=3054953 RepID=UPI00259CC3E1|nr:sugar-transfer associated ATP-grasp domain-containing protein [Pelomonas sp. SE-A7]MDM4766485.1 sugar-transfer associated ATP-grasp domain-containing protein [Pelomonas sp. SE-A7]